MSCWLGMIHYGDALCLLLPGHGSTHFLTHHATRDLMGIAKSIDPGQPAQSVQSDHGQNFSLLADFQCIK